MRSPTALFAAACALACAGPALADSADFTPDGSAELSPYLQCVPYARERSGVQIYGDAHTWWDQAEGRYRRGHVPRAGAVMAFRAHGSMRLGHVAAVTRVIDSRTVLLDHANWSPIDGRRGQIERGVRAIDVSSANDWSEVRVWYDPLQDLGTTAWPVEGFIYNERAESGRAVLARADFASPAPDATAPAPSRRFLEAFASLAEPEKKPVEPRRPAVRRIAAGPDAVAPQEQAAEQPPAAKPRVEPRRPAVRAIGYQQPAPAPKDPLAEAIAKYDRR